MIKTDRALARLDDAVARLLEEREDIGVRVTVFGPLRDRASVEVTRLGRDECARCGQALDTRHPGPVESISEHTGDVVAIFSHQHGCGQWNTPAHASDVLDLDDDPDEHDISELLRGLVATVDDEVAEEAH